MIVVDRMLRLGNLKAGEKMFDLGSGDGRIVIAAAKKYKAEATGIEIDEDLVRRSNEAIRKQHVDKLARVIQGDILQQDYSSADLITVYLWPEANLKVGRLLDKQVKRGTRVVAHDFEFLEWKPDKTDLVEDDGTGRARTIYLYVR
jgi:16S rRNA A1518/A1519 N6-dimethyltransferase RsmA/KsgA/DIM1 with predicted DNA glycosylase/AP lyase activity